MTTAGSKPLRVLIVTKIFPNALEPLSAPFNRQQFAALAQQPSIQSVEILASIPWFPGAGLVSRWSSAGKLAGVPRSETIAGMAVHHPRTLFVPRLAHSLWGPLYAASLAPLVARYRGKIDIVLGSWAYPDGFAAVVLAQLLGVPAVVKLHGSDINVITKIPGPRKLSAWALPRAQKIVAVSRALADEVCEIGVSRDRVEIVMNGVDGDLFKPRDRAAARTELGLDDSAPTALYVGNLKEAKGILDLLTAWSDVRAKMPNARLVVVGGGELSAQVKIMAAPLGDSVVLAGPQKLETIPTWMAASDLLTLPSWNEGTPNVVLEALASGRRVVASAVGGIPDLITSPQLGALVPPKNPDALATALLAALGQADQTAANADAVAAVGARGGWAASAAALAQVLHAAVLP